MLVRKTVIITGRVQGVGFRYFVARTARALGLKGAVCNRSNGSVMVIAEGDAHEMGELMAALRTGPSGAQVIDIQIKDKPVTGNLAPFTITV